MRNWIEFQRLRFIWAWRGSWSRANEAAALLGGLLLFAVVLWLRPVLKEYGLVEAPTSVIGTIAFSFASAVACLVLSFIVIVCCRFLIAPSRLYSTLVSDRDGLRTQLIAIGSERPLAYENADFRIYRISNNATDCDLEVKIVFKNHGARMLRWRMIGASFEADGVTAQTIPISQYYFVNKGQVAWFHYPSLMKVLCSSWPITATVMFELEYDNVPPVNIRITKRVIRFLIDPPPSTNLRSFELLSEER